MFRNTALVLFLLIPNLVSAQAAANDAVYGRFSNGILGYTTTASLNSANTDIPITIKSSKYVVTGFIITNVSATPVLATLALYTAASAGGTNLVAAAVLTGLTSAPVYTGMTLINNTATLTAATLYARNVVAQGSGLTVDIYIIGYSLP